jgi:hypothetical protein
MVTSETLGVPPVGLHAVLVEVLVSVVKSPLLSETPQSLASDSM